MQTKKDVRANAEVSISGTLPKEAVSAEVEKVLARIQKELTLPGFRQGKAPAEKVREQVGEKALWREAAETALNKGLESLLKEHEVMPLMPVSASINAGDVDADVTFEIIAIVAPTCSIKDFKKVAADALAKIPADDAAKEKETALKALRAQARQMTQTEGEGEFSDEDAKKLGFESGAVLEHFLKEESERAVGEREVQKKRGAIAEALITNASCSIPRIMILDEAKNLLDATKRDIASQGVPFNDYLKRAGKTEEDITKELQNPAEKRVALDIIFAEIAQTEKIEADAKEEERLSHALVQQGVPHDRAHSYVRTMVMREKIWEMLGAKAVARNDEPAIEQGHSHEGRDHSDHSDHKH